MLMDRGLSHWRPTVLVIGDVMCDVYIWGEVERLSPEAPVPVIESKRQQRVLGGAANVAANLHAFGCEVRVLSVVGADATGRCRDLVIRDVGAPQKALTVSVLVWDGTGILLFGAVASIE